MSIDSDFEKNNFATGDRSESENTGTLETLFQTLITLLNDERDALIHHDGERLESLSEQKLEVCNHISLELEASPALGKKIALAAAADSQADPEFDPSHVLLAQLATQARDYNLVNGKILHRSQQSVREILGIMSGQSIDGLYGQSGQQDAKAIANSGASIRA
jgi:flagellar biosynthesis protein FlgN